MNARVLIPIAGLLLLAVALWLVLGGGDDGDPAPDEAAAGVSAGAESEDAPLRDDAEPSSEARDEAKAGASEDSGAGAASAAPSATARPRGSDDDDSATLDPADRADADPTLVFSPDRAGIKGAVDESLPQIKECYEGWLTTRPDLSGRMLVQFVIAGNPDEPDFAEIRDVTLVDSELGHSLMEGCVASLFEELQFEAPDGGGEVKVSYPLRFTTDK